MTDRSKPTWSEVTGKLAAFDRPRLIDLMQDLYAAIRQANAALIPATLERVLAGNP